MVRIKEFFNRFEGLTQIGLGNVIPTAISGIFWLYVANLLGTEGYGEISYFIAIAGITVVFSFLGGGNTLIVYVAKGVKIQSPIYFISLVAAIIASIVLYFLLQNFAVSLFVIGNVLFSLTYSELLGLKSFKTYRNYLILQRILMVVFALSFYEIIGLDGIILGMALSFFPFSFRLVSIFKKAKLEFALIKTRFNFIFNNYLLSISRTFSSSTDKLIVAPLFGFAILGNYQLGVHILGILGIVPGIVLQYTLTHDASGKSNKKLKKISIIVSIFLAVLIAWSAPFLIPQIFPEYVESVPVIQIMSFSVIPLAITNTYISKFLGAEKSKIILIGSVIFVLVLIVSIIILGELYSIVGIAVAFLVAQISEAIFLTLYQRLLKP